MSFFQMDINLNNNNFDNLSPINKINLPKTKIKIPINNKKSKKNYQDVEVKVFFSQIFELYLGEKNQIIMLNKQGKLVYSQIDYENYDIIPSNEEYNPKKENPFLKLEQYNQFLNKLNEMKKNLIKKMGKYKNDALLEGPQTNFGKVVFLSIILNFSDDGGDFKDISNNIKNFINKDVKKYFWEVSGQKLNVETVEPVVLKLNYKFGEFCMERSNKIPGFIEEGLKKTPINDIDKLTLNKNGGIAAIMIFYGREKVYQNYAAPHNDYCSISVIRKENNEIYSSYYFSIQGIISHELGHMLMRYPDLYYYGNRDLIESNDTKQDKDKIIKNENKQKNVPIQSNGMGKLCLMSLGYNLTTPPAPCAYLRLLGGFLNPKIIEEEVDKEYQLTDDFSDSLIFYKDKSKNEGFIFELRGKKGFDDEIFKNSFNKKQRLGIYHFDKEGSNEWNENSNEFHYQCMIEEANCESGKGKLINEELFDGDFKCFFDENTEWGVKGIVLNDKIFNSEINSEWWDGSDSKLNVKYLGNGKVKVFFNPKNADEEEEKLKMEIEEIEKKKKGIEEKLKKLSAKKNSKRGKND